MARQAAASEATVEAIMPSLEEAAIRRLIVGSRLSDKLEERPAAIAPTDPDVFIFDEATETVPDADW